jgi:glycosyltransferase involved in cell wall biosynthesis
MPKVSVIIPIYNVEKHLKRCLDSVCNQTLSDIEIICINDCSPDNSLNILNEYAKNDSRIKIIDFKQNQGVAVVRNTGIDSAKGEFISFVDSDDFIDLEYYEKLYKTAKETNSELVLAGIDYSIDLEFLYNIKESRCYFNGVFVIGFYKTSLLQKNNIKFIENCCYGEDRLLPLKASILANNIEVYKNVKYHYTNNPNSVTKSTFTLKKIDDYIKSLDKLFEFINNANITEKDYNVIINAFKNQIIGFALQIDDLLLKKYTNLIEIFYNRIKYESSKKDFLVCYDNKNNITKIKNIAKLESNKAMLNNLRKNIRNKK